MYFKIFKLDLFNWFKVTQLYSLIFLYWIVTSSWIVTSLFYTVLGVTGRSNFNLYETIYTAKHSLFWLVVFQERSYHQLNIDDIIIIIVIIIIIITIS